MSRNQKSDKTTRLRRLTRKLPGVSRGSTRHSSQRNQIEFDENAPLLEINNLVVEYETRNSGNVVAVDDVSFRIDEREMFGLIGESGCGKSTAAKAIMGLLPNNGSIAEGEVLLQGVDLAQLSREELNQVRLKHVALINQAAMNALNPVYKISDQIIEGLQTHEDISKNEARERVAELFDMVGLDPDRMDDYPHQFSGGMKQRAYIALALAHDPKLVIADEPTTALDVIVQDQILKRLKELQNELDLSFLIITHDISVIAETCDRLGIMYSGKMMEYGDLKSIFRNPHNPYTLGLKNAFPSVSNLQDDLISIPGSPPNPSELPEGCRFTERCPFSTYECETKHPPLEQIGDDHYSACYHHDKHEMMQKEATQPETWMQQQEQADGRGDDDE